MADTDHAAWRSAVYRVLKDAHVKHVVYVPDAGHASAIRMAEADAEVTSVVLTTEQDLLAFNHSLEQVYRESIIG